MTVIVAGMVVLDLIPALPADEKGFEFKPGTIIRTGPARVAAGGAVSNTGGALHRLGVPVRLVGKVGDDPFGNILQDLLADSGECRLLVSPGEATAHSFVLSPPGHDRMIINHPGASNTFHAGDIPADLLEGGRIFHFGYPTAMARMYAEDGRYLVELLAKVREAGLVTSLDMSYPDPSSPGGRADWPKIFAAALPLVDFFMPSLAEAVIVLRQPGSGDAPARDLSADQVSAEYISELGRRYVELGTAILAIKMGEGGIYLRTGSREKLAPVAAKLGLDLDAWADREIWSNSFQVQVAGTIGAGDATAGGLLLGLVNAMQPEDMLTAACAVGASRVEGVDARSAVVPWEQVAARIASGWSRRDNSPGEGWRNAGTPGIWLGPADRS